MTHSPAQVMSQLLVDLGVASGPGGAGEWPVFTANLPDRPDNCIQVKNTTGVDESDLFTAGDSDQHWGVQIMVRAADEQAAWAKVHAVRAALRGVLNRGVRVGGVGGTSYAVPAVAGLSPPLALGMDKPSSTRTLYTLNPTFAATQL